MVGGNPDVATTRCQFITFSQGAPLMIRQLRPRRDGSIALGLLLCTLIPLGAARVQQGGQIVFQSEVDGNTDIYVMDGDGTNVRRLTDHPTRDHSPRWSPGGSRIAFVSGRDDSRQVYTMDPDGGAVGRVTETRTGAQAPAWSQDGGRIAFFAMYREYGIHSIDRDGQNLRFLTGPPDRKGHPGNHFQEQSGGIDWSPNGWTLIFNAHGGGPDAASIWAIDADGKNARKLTEGGHDVCQAWSPDGRRILFLHIGNERGFFTMDPDGRDRTEIFRIEAAGCPRWSASGQEIVFVMDGDIHIVSATGRNLRRLVELPGDERNPDWFDPAFARAVTARSKIPVAWGRIKRRRD